MNQCVVVFVVVVLVEVVVVVVLAVLSSNQNILQSSDGFVGVIWNCCRPSEVGAWSTNMSAIETSQYWSVSFSAVQCCIHALAPHSSFVAWRLSGYGVGVTNEMLWVQLTVAQLPGNNSGQVVYTRMSLCLWHQAL